MANYQSKHTGAEIDAGIDKANDALLRTGGTMQGALVLNGAPTNSFEAANKQYVDDTVSDAVSEATENIDPATAILDHDADSTAHSSLFANKVDKVSGKGLSANDYTNADKNKLDGVAEGANNYSHPSTHAANEITGIASVQNIAGGKRFTVNDADGPHSVDIMDGGGGSSGGGSGSGDVSEAINTHDVNADAHAALFDEKVDKETGKGLSTNDYTTAEKNKLAGVATNANNYTHPSTHAASMIDGLAPVATSNNFNDLDNKPSIPSVAGLASQTYVGEQIAAAAGNYAPNAHNHASVLIDSTVYGLRTGTEGAAGFITFVLE